MEAARVEHERRHRPHLRVVGDRRKASWTRTWWATHELHDPSPREAWAHAWPWLVVAGMLSYAGCLWGLVLPGAVLSVLLILAIRSARR